MSAVFPAPITPADRERAEGYLKDAYADGLLGEAEFDTRMGQVMAAGSRSELTASCAGIVGVRPSVPRPRIAGGTGLATAAHFSGIASSFIGPWLAYQVATPRSFARREAAKAFNFQVVSIVALVTTFVLTAVFFDRALGTVLPLGWLAWFLLSVTGGVQAAKGRSWRNPVTRVLPWEVLREDGR
ncbi:DUF1707 and DUF4870 domain-containing protein [Nigerium sp.]|jgi:uncharacterized Tic20 family protein|uniref:DUF1707 and DUF4870 domain-containing protein n=1 Tax=Nigerium sp. TaxID=2042655 RepID=UPI0032216760